MAWWKYNKPTRTFEFSENNGTTFAAPELDAAIITHGTFPDSRLSGNVTLNNVVTNFSVPQNLLSGSSITGNNSLINLNDTGGGIDLKRWRFLQYNDGLLRIEALNDAYNAILGQIGFGRNGSLTTQTTIRAGTDFYEKGRGLPLGTWFDEPFSAGQYGFPVTSAARAYSYIGNIVLQTIHVSAATIPASPILYIYTAFTANRLTAGYAIVNVNGNYLPVSARMQSGVNSIMLFRSTYPESFPAGNFNCEVTIPISIA